MKESEIYRELSDKKLNELVETALQTKMVSARLLSGGLFNTTYLVDTEKYGKTVLRLGPVNRHLLMPFEHRLMEAEKYVYDLCTEQDIPVSQVLAMDLSKTLVDRDFMFVRYIPGFPLSEGNLTEPEKVCIYRDVGIATAKMHRITAPRFGRVAEVKNGGGFRLWSEALLYELYEWEKVGIPASIFTVEEHDRIRFLFEQAVPFLDEVKVPHLVHTDLWGGNILIGKNADIPEFAAIIDGDRALFGDPWFEFSSIQWTYGEESFWEGYGSRLPEEPADRVRRSIYILLNRLWNAYVYLIEYNQPENAVREANDARMKMEDLKEMFIVTYK